MSGGLLYLDSSAIVKLIRCEPETEALIELLADWPERVTSALVGVEVARAVNRAGEGASTIRLTGEVISRLGLIRVDGEVLRTAAGILPKDLRTLHAIHLFTALSLGEQLGGMVVYDNRLADAARENGLSTLSPGTDHKP